MTVIVAVENDQGCAVAWDSFWGDDLCWQPTPGKCALINPWLLVGGGGHGRPTQLAIRASGNVSFPSVERPEDWLMEVWIPRVQRYFAEENAEMREGLDFLIVAIKGQPWIVSFDWAVDRPSDGYVAMGDSGASAIALGALAVTPRRAAVPRAEAAIRAAYRHSKNAAPPVYSAWVRKR